MNETTRPEDNADLPRPSTDQRMPVPDTSMLPGSESAKPTPAVVSLLNQAVRGAHDTIDRLADRAAPVVRQLGEGVSAAEDALHEKTGELRAKQDEWADSVRGLVRDNPLVCVAAALALGAVVARITQRD